MSLLQHNFNGRIIHPTGTWEGTYFSEELKAAVKHGYSIQILSVLHFSKQPDLFKSYINHFYELKKEATANKDVTNKAIAKLHLNSLYGMFGRGLDLLSSVIAIGERQKDVVSKYPVKSIINVNIYEKKFKSKTILCKGIEPFV